MLMTQIYDQADSYEYHREQMEKAQAIDDELKEKNLDDSDWDIIQDYYFAEYASHNEDFAGAERWMEELSYDECLTILKKNNG